jgi:hypothetical protein
VKSREEKATSSEPQGKGHPVKGRKERANQCWPAKKGPPVQCRKERATSAPTACDHMKMEEELGFVCAAICFALTVVFVRWVIIEKFIARIPVCYILFVFLKGGN